MTKVAPECVRTSDPVIRSPVRYRWTTAPAGIVRGSLIDGTIEGDLNLSTDVEVASTRIKSRAIRVREVSRKLKRCL